jgi:hypothetical protein
MRSAVYNSKYRLMPFALPLPRYPSALLLLLFLAVASFGADWTSPEQQLAQKIVAVTGPGAMSLEVVNRSSLSNADVDSIRAGLRTQLDALGVHLVGADQAAATVQVSLSENLQSYLWIAQIQQSASQSNVVMVPVPRSTPALAVHEPAGVLIRKIQLWSQDERILDVGVIDTSPPRIIVLDAEKIALYGLQGGRWQQDQTFPVNHPRPWPRDLRGRVVLRKDHLFDAYLPGVICTSGSGAPLSVTCQPSDDPWPIGSDLASLSAFFSPTRNFFTGALAPGIGKETTVPNFYSAAPIPRSNYILWLFAGTDGQFYEVDGMSRQSLSRPLWGSDLASVKTSCGSGWQVITSSNSDGALPDAIRAYEFPDRDPVAVSQPVELNGVVTALWTESSGMGAVVVVRNLQTERYEAYRLAITCGQ